MVGNSAEGSPRKRKMSNIAYQQLNFDREWGTTKPSIHINMGLNVLMGRISKGEMKETLSKGIKGWYTDGGP